MADNKVNQIIISLVESEEITDQHEFLKLLEERGVKLNQPGLSRKLEKLKIRKEHGIYRMPLSLSHKNSTVLNFAVAKPNLILIHTMSGFAGSIAAEIDREREQNNKLFKDVIGTIAGDDTILVVGKNPVALDKIVSNLAKHFMQ